MKGISNNILKGAAIFFLVIFIVLSGTGHSDRLIGKLGMERLNAANEAYLQNSFDRALKGFMALSALKMGLAVIKDSEAGISIGVSTQLRIGGLVQSAYDYVDIAWKTLLAGTGVLLGMGYILDALAIIDGPFLTVTLFILLVTLLFKWFLPTAVRSYRFSRDMALVMTVITLSLYLVVPFSLSGAALLSTYITAPSINEAQANMDLMKKELFPENVPASDKGLYERLKGAKERLEEVASYLKTRAKEMTVWVIKIITGYIFDCIVFPLLLFIVLFKLVKSVALYGFGVNREEDFRQDLYDMLEQHYVKRGAGGQLQSIDTD
ncbi:MAG: hypothetical protein OEV42_06405 [Deltaproteobacteria bacterium]|nr:hypothetical protein [Deltaproteobacteria bacterium]